MSEIKQLNVMKLVKGAIRNELITDFLDNFCTPCLGGDCDCCVAHKVHMSHIACIKD